MALRVTCAAYLSDGNKLMIFSSMALYYRDTHTQLSLIFTIEGLRNGDGTRQKRKHAEKQIGR